MDRWTPLQVLISAFSISSLAGLAALLRSEKQLSIRVVLSTILYSGMSGVIIALIWYRHFGSAGNGEGSIFFLLGISGLAGIGGTTMLDFVVEVIKKGGINITFAPGEKQDDQDE